eukprot:TRINITY_DN36503_c2_g1_i2.p4 TRINITY_DN36503_c2_g1~~TRINITY_DN36503_c2_g1_i2.p4  ORF type:complete len:154 (+),score=21.51 TRINITY_DN36503_c2_g1_i2:31-462(+)
MEEKDQPTILKKRKERGYRKKTETQQDEVEEEVQLVSKRHRLLANKSKAQEEPEKLTTFQYKGTGEVQMRGDAGATKAVETETEFDKDSRALREKVLASSTQERRPRRRRAARCTRSRVGNHRRTTRVRSRLVGRRFLPACRP